MQPEEPVKPQPGAVFHPGDAVAPTQPDPVPPAAPPPPPAVVPPIPEPAPEPPVVQSQVPADEPIDTPLVAWQASEYIHHDKRFSWYAIFFLMVAVAIGVAVVTHQWLTIGVFVVMASALVVYANKAPRVLNYSLGDGGIMIETKFYPYNSFRSFGLIQDVAWHLIDLEPLRRFMPRLSIMFEDDKRDQILAILTQHIPRQDRQPDLIERAARYLHF